MSWLRTHTCGELTIENKGKEVVLNGWVSKRRDLGGLIFIDLRDRYGITQIVFDETNSALHSMAEDLRSEYVIGVRGKVINRSDETVNPDMKTGELEVEVSELKVYSKAQTPPFEIKDDLKTNEETRLKYRYLDLRRAELQKNLILRSEVYHTIRNFYHDRKFTEVETPVLMKSTPEGARDYLVPSRVNAGKFFALPQSPQTYKQLLMVSGFDRYFQIVKCFRDEDLRADRQPEFTQVDVEMSFVDEEVIYTEHEALMANIWKDHLGVELKTPFPRMSYDDAMKTYGSDKPDLRFDVEIHDISDDVAESGFKIFNSTVDKGGRVLSITVPGEGSMGRGALDRLTDKVTSETGAAGMIFMKLNEGEITCSVGKFLDDETMKNMAETSGAKEGDLVLILAGPTPDVYKQMGGLRLIIGNQFDLIDRDQTKFLWVTDFPLVEWSKEDLRYHALHHPFTSPKEEDLDKLESDPKSVKARAYDLVLNGNEIGGGSIRIHTPELQQQMFSLLGIDEEEAEEKFGFLLDAFKYGAPPHGGIALGLDRIVMLMSGAGSLRDVIAFPKNQKAQSPMDSSPSEVSEEQLKELHISLRKTANN
ncbi:aspartate--tRNA ligase [Rhodohalobacter barkolensis]|uniref:Aspartate--tRNA ligase n=1 Tax=Rhodohalobacter barkolensis TaxID=2053187 RepID=A0A2N0VM53_9BACT|nr:aspartate--tRNA ligase [Rhodohalobacter barkolensis]PKD45278.1 aspartate--tRNA ligase [Rhodohalobacter barkolensis]